VERLHLLADRIAHVIDFRYHLVSIVAVFLALAIGIVFGSTALKGTVAQQLEGQAQSLTGSNKRLQERVRALELLQSGNDEFAREVGRTVLKEQLSGHSVVFVQLPGAPEPVRIGLDAAVRQAGATVSGQVAVTDKYLSDEQSETVDGLAARLAQGSDPPPTGTPYDRAAAKLATALVTNQPATVGQEDTSSGQVLSAFQDSGFVTLSPKFGGRANLAIVIPPAAPVEGEGAAADNAALLALIRALDINGRGAVLAGPTSAAAEGGLIAALRDSDASAAVSSSDTADTRAGQIVAVLALVHELDGKSAHYGVGSGVDRFAPSPVPTPPK
jgi:hypothetical protein